MKPRVGGRAGHRPHPGANSEVPPPRRWSWGFIPALPWTSESGAPSRGSVLGRAAASPDPAASKPSLCLTLEQQRGDSVVSLPCSLQRAPLSCCPWVPSSAQFRGAQGSCLLTGLSWEVELHVRTFGLSCLVTTVLSTCPGLPDHSTTPQSGQRRPRKVPTAATT